MSREVLQPTAAKPPTFIRVLFCAGLLISGAGFLDASPYSDGKKHEKVGAYEAAFQCYQRAYAERDSKRYLEAMQRVGKIVARDRYRKADTYWQETQDIDGALTKLEGTLKFDATNALALSLKQKIAARRDDALGKLQSALTDSEAGRHESALKTVKFAALVYRDHQPIQEGWLKILRVAVRDRIEQSDFVRGAELLKEGTEKLDPSQLKDITAELHFAVGKALARDGDYKSAIDACAKAEALVPDLPGLEDLRKAAQENLAGQLVRDGNEYITQKKWKLAVDNFTEAFLLNPSFEGIQQKVAAAKDALGQQLLEDAAACAEQDKPANALIRYVAASALAPDSEELGTGAEKAKKAIEDRVTFRVGIRGFENASESAELPSRLANKILDHLFQKSLDTLQIVDLSGEQWASEIAEQTGAKRERKKPISVFIDGAVYPVKKENRRVASSKTSQVQVGATQAENPEYATIVASQNALIRALPELGKAAGSVRDASSSDYLGSLLKMSEIYQTGRGKKRSKSLDQALKTYSSFRSSTGQASRTYSTGTSSGSLGQALNLLSSVQSTRSRSKSSRAEDQALAAALEALQAMKTSAQQPPPVDETPDVGGTSPEGVPLKPSTLETLMAILQEDSQRKAFALAKREMDSLAAALRSTTRFIEQPVYANADAGGETHIKTALASCYVKIREFKSGKLLFSRRFAKTHMASDHATPGNPELGVAADPVDLPSDIQMEETVITGLFAEVSEALFEYLRNYGAGYIMLAQQDSRATEERVERQLDYLFSYTARDNPPKVRELHLDLQRSVKDLLPRSEAPKVPSALSEFLGAMPEAPAELE